MLVFNVIYYHFKNNLLLSKATNLELEAMEITLDVVVVGVWDVYMCSEWMLKRTWGLSLSRVSGRLRAVYSWDPCRGEVGIQGIGRHGVSGRPGLGEPAVSGLNKFISSSDSEPETVV